MERIEDRRRDGTANSYAVFGADRKIGWGYLEEDLGRVGVHDHWKRQLTAVAHPIHGALYTLVEPQQFCPSCILAQKTAIESAQNTQLTAQHRGRDDRAAPKRLIGFTQMRDPIEVEFRLANPRRPLAEHRQSDRLANKRVALEDSMHGFEHHDLAMARMPRQRKFIKQPAEADMCEI